MSPPFKSPVRRTLVAETPSHKQKNSAMWKRQEAERRRSQSSTVVKVVEESPLKSGKADLSTSTGQVFIYGMHGSINVIRLIYVRNIYECVSGTLY